MKLFNKSLKANDELTSRETQEPELLQPMPELVSEGVEPLVMHIEGGESDKEALRNLTRKLTIEEEEKPLRQAAQPKPEPLVLEEDIGKADGSRAEADNLTSVSIESIAKMIAEKSGEQKEATRTRATIDDDTLLSEIYALIGKPEQAEKPAPPLKPQAESKPAKKPEPVLRTPEEEKPAPVKEQRPEPSAREKKEWDVPQAESLHLPPFVMEGDEPEEPHPVEVREGTPGWLKGMFLLVISLLLSGMTLYAVAADVMGKVF